METPEEKAKRLGVPLLPTPDMPAYIPEKEDARREQDKFIKQMQRHINGLVCVCSCGKEITRQMYVSKTPCGDQRCPFGYETN